MSASTDSPTPLLDIELQLTSSHPKLLPVSSPRYSATSHIPSRCRSRKRAQDQRLLLLGHYFTVDKGEIGLWFHEPGRDRLRTFYRRVIAFYKISVASKYFTVLWRCSLHFTWNTPIFFKNVCSFHMSTHDSIWVHFNVNFTWTTPIFTKVTFII
jgi:hypothetical protein